MEIKKYAAIDIGSNGVRILISNIITEKNKIPLFRKSSLVRVPIRLGADSFIHGKISEENKNRMIDAMNAFRLLMNVHNVEKYRACATSAFREASNCEQVVQDIYSKSTIKIDVIDGETEATIIFGTDLKQYINPTKSYLYIDVGGGSTELTLFSKGKIINSKSFKLGTVRLLNNQEITKKEWKNLENWIKYNTKNLKHVSIIGSGGNINKIFKLSGKVMGKPLTYSYIKETFNYLKNLTYEERITELALNPDRADVIIHATKIFLNSMKWAKAHKIFVPKIGLSDGIVKSLYTANNQ